MGGQRHVFWEQWIFERLSGTADELCKLEPCFLQESYSTLLDEFHGSTRKVPKMEWFVKIM